MNKRVWGRALAAAAAGAISLSALAACSTPAADTDSGKTEISMMYFSPLPDFEALVEAEYPDIDLIVEQNTSATLDNESERRLKNGHGSDIIMTTLPGGIVKDYTMDISAEEFILNYSSAINKDLLIDGRTHYVPLPGQYYGYIVNETLINELGFELPQSNEEIYNILEAAKAAGKGVGVNGDSIGFYNIGENYLANLMFGSFVPDFLSTPDGIIWLSDLQQGKAKFSGTMEGAMDFILHCTEEGYFDSGTVLSTSSVTISDRNAVHVDERLLQRTMVLIYGDTEIYRKLVNDSTGDKFTMLPFLSSSDRPGWLISIGNGYLALNNELKSDEKKLDAALRVLSLLSTEEGQRVWMKDTDAVVSYLKDSSGLTQDLPESIRDTVSNGYVFNSTLPNNIVQYFGRQMNMVISGKATLAEAMSAVDNYGRTGFSSAEQAQEVVGKVDSDLIYQNYNTRKEETAIGNLIADAVKLYSGADIALVNGGGIRSSLYAGEVWDADLAAVCPYGNLIITVNVPGNVLKAALSNSISQTDRGEQVPGGRFLQVSGIHYTFRAMKDENDTAELISVTLPDGTPIDDNATYLVAITNYMAGSSSYADGNGDGFTMLNVYDDNEPKLVALVKETGGTFRDALKAYFAANSGNDISSKAEGRITVVK